MSPVIYLDKLDRIEILINDFVRELSYLYSPRIMLSGAHELLHMIDETLEYGPLNSINCFQFEEMNRKMINFIHGFDLIGEELIKVFSTAQYLSSSFNDINNYELKIFIASKLKLKSSNIKNTKSSLNPNVYIKSKEITKNQSFIKLIQSYISQNNLSEITISYNITFNGIQYSSYLNKTKRCDSCFYLENRKFGLIECFVIYNRLCAFLFKNMS